MNWSFYSKVSINILIAKSTALNCTINIDEELNYIELFKICWIWPDRNGAKPSPKHLNGMYVSAFALCVSVIVPVSTIQSHCSKKYPNYFCIENKVRQKPTCHNLREMCFKKLFSLILGLLQAKWCLARHLLSFSYNFIIIKRLIWNYRILMKSLEIRINRWVRNKNSFILKRLFSCPEILLYFLVSIKVPLTSSTKTTWLSCCLLEILRSKATQFWGLVKITKPTLHLRYWGRNKSKPPIPITHCATRVINIE